MTPQLNILDTVTRHISYASILPHTCFTVDGRLDYLCQAVVAPRQRAWIMNPGGKFDPLKIITFLMESRLDHWSLRKVQPESYWLVSYNGPSATR